MVANYTKTPLFDRVVKFVRQGIAFTGAVGVFACLLTSSTPPRFDNEIIKDQKSFASRKVVSCEQAVGLIEQMRSCAKEIGYSKPIIFIDTDRIYPEGQKKTQEELRPHVRRELLSQLNIFFPNSVKAPDFNFNIIKAFEGMVLPYVQGRSGGMSTGAFFGVMTLSTPSANIDPKYALVSKERIAWHEYGHLFQKTILSEIPWWSPPPSSSSLIDPDVLSGKDLQKKFVTSIRNYQAIELNADYMSLFMAQKNAKVKAVNNFKLFRVESLNAYLKAAQENKKHYPLVAAKTFMKAFYYGNIPALEKGVDLMEHIAQASWGKVESTLQKSFSCYYHNSQDKTDAAVTCYMNVLKAKGMKGLSVHQVGVLAGAMTAKNTMDHSQIRRTYSSFLKKIGVVSYQTAERQQSKALKGEALTL